MGTNALVRAVVGEPQRPSEAKLKLLSPSISKRRTPGNPKKRQHPRSETVLAELFSSTALRHKLPHARKLRKIRPSRNYSEGSFFLRESKRSRYLQSRNAIRASRIRCAKRKVTSQGAKIDSKDANSEISSLPTLTPPPMPVPQVSRLLEF